VWCEKIENIMVDGRGHIKLIDFGLCHRLESDIDELTAAGSILYMAPVAGLLARATESVCVIVWLAPLCFAGDH
jgi:hypothetical protein